MCTRRLRDGSNTKLDHWVAAADDFLKRYAILHEVLPGPFAHRAARHCVETNVDRYAFSCFHVVVIHRFLP
jgi:hypothetical protein